MTTRADRLAAAGEIGGRTVQIDSNGRVVCHRYRLAPLPDGQVRVRTIRTAISPGTEMTFLGMDASNVHLRKRWDEGLRLFEPGAPALDYPITFGYRAAGMVTESQLDDAPVGMRVYGNWHHTEYTTMSAARAIAQQVPADLDWDDALDLGQMGPICVNAAACADGREIGHPAVVIGAGPIGLITAQIVAHGGARPVYVIDRLRERLDIATGLGLAVEHSTPDADVARTLKSRHGSDGIPVAWECSGTVTGLATAIRMVRRRGVVIAVGFYQGGASVLELSDEFHHNAVSVVSAQIGNPHPPFDRSLLQARTIQLARDAALTLGALPRTTMPVEAAADAFEALKRPDQVFQVVLTYE